MPKNTVDSPIKNPTGSVMRKKITKNTSPPTKRNLMRYEKKRIILEASPGRPLSKEPTILRSALKFKTTIMPPNKTPRVRGNILKKILPPVKNNRAKMFFFSMEANSIFVMASFPHSFTETI